MRKPLFLAAAIAAVSTVALAEEAMRVRFINALSADPLTVKVGDSTLFQSVKPKEITEFKSVIDKNRKLSVTTANGQQIAPDRSIELDAANERLTIVALPGKAAGDKPSLNVIKRDLGGVADKAGDNEAGIELINASIDVGAADLFVGDNKVHAGVNFGGRDGPDDIEAGSKSIRVVDGRTKSDIASLTLNLKAGQTYTAVVFGATDAKVVDDTGGTQSPVMGGAAGGTATGGGTITGTGKVPAPSSSGMSPAAPDTVAPKSDTSTLPAPAPVEKNETEPETGKTNSPQ